MLTGCKRLQVAHGPGVGSVHHSARHGPRAQPASTSQPAPQAQCAMPERAHAPAAGCERLLAASGCGAAKAELLELSRCACICRRLQGRCTATALLLRARAAISTTALLAA